MHIELTREQFFTRGGILDEVLSKICDSCVLVDAEGIVIHRIYNNETFGARPVNELIGRPITESDPASPFTKVLKSGKAELDFLVILNNRKCVTNIFPVKSQGVVIGAIGAVVFRNMTGLRSVLAQLEAQSGKDDRSSNYDKFSRLESTYTFADYIGESLVVKNLVAQAERVALSKCSTLIIGETGTGKEIIAGGIHSYQQTSFTPFIKINCSAIPDTLLEAELFGHEKGAFTNAITTKKGKFELAAGGSVLLDEIGEMDLRLQGKLLRVLEEREFERVGGTKMIPLNARVIASTNQDLYRLCNEGKFRRDLYFRLSTLELYTPPLRTHLEDIPLLVNHLSNRDQLNVTFDDSAIAELQRMPWRGNVRELRNIINRASVWTTSPVVSGELIRAIFADRSHAGYQELTAVSADVEPPSFPTPVNASPIEEAEQLTIVNALSRNSYNISRTAAELKITRATLYAKMKKYHL